MDRNKVSTSLNAAQTASLGDNQMMTYMKMSLPPTTNPGSGSPSGSGDSDNNFLDGLFDPMSGSSDNGSEKAGSDNGMNGNSFNITSRPDGNTNLGVMDDGPDIGTGTSMTPTPIGPLSSNMAPSVAASMQLPMNPLQAQGHSASAVHHMASTNTGTTASINVPNHPGAFQHHLPQQNQQQQHHLQQQQQNFTHGTNNGGNGNDQANNATRAMSDVSSLTSSSNGNSTPPYVQYQTNDSRTTYAAVNASNLMPTPQPQQQPQVSAVNSNMVNTNQALQTWIVPSTAISNPTNGMVQTVAYPTTSMIQTQTQAPQQHQIAPQPPKQTNPPKTTKATRGKGRKRRHNSNGPQTTSSKQTEHAPISEDEADGQKRRRDRNMREQERSQRIANQILQLKELLAASNIPFKPDKYSTLISVHGYIKSLQERNSLVDAEQKKLVDTITDTNDLVNKAQLGPNAIPNSSSRQTGTGSDGNAQVIPGAAPISEEEEELLQYVRGVDYKSVFTRINIALCVTRIDGRLFDCNNEFVRLCGLTNDELFKAGLKKPTQQEVTPEITEQFGKHPLSLFNLIAKEDMHIVFQAMSRMLTSEQSKGGSSDEVAIKSENPSGRAQLSNKINPLDHWAGNIQRCRASTNQVCHFVLCLNELFYMILIPM
jgi:PAS domain-containing protein